MRVKTFQGTQFRSGVAQCVDDTLAVEAVLQIKLNGIPYTTTVRTPGEDTHLARGLLYTEQVVVDPRAELTFREVRDPETGLCGCLEVSVAPEFIAKDIEGRRSAMVSASCGLCGIREPSELPMEGPPLRVTPGEHFDVRRLPTLLEAMTLKQNAFNLSGGCHAAAAFDPNGETLCVYEDIGRHNAVDKVAGYLLAAALLDRVHCLIVSGRVSYEIVFKAYRARIPILLAVSAPSSLAVEMAQRFGITLAAFCRDGRATVYAHEERVIR